MSVYISKSADNSLYALSSTPHSKLYACKHMISHLESGVRSGYLTCCEGTRWAWYTLVQGHKQFILDQ
jgi:hypothetical protein